MPADIFNRETSKLAGSFAADKARLVIQGTDGSAAGLSALAQRLQLSYQQQVSRIYELGSPNIYYVGGRTQGNMSLSRIIGPQLTISALYAAYGDICKANKAISFVVSNPNCLVNESGQTVTFSALNCVITGVAVGVQSNDMMITDDTTMMFSSLTSSGGAANGGNAARLSDRVATAIAA